MDLITLLPRISIMSTLFPLYYFKFLYDIRTSRSRKVHSVENSNRMVQLSTLMMRQRRHQFISYGL